MSLDRKVVIGERNERKRVMGGPLLALVLETIVSQNVLKIVKIKYPNKLTGLNSDKKISWNRKVSNNFWRIFDLSKVCNSSVKSCWYYFTIK